MEAKSDTLNRLHTSVNLTISNGTELSGQEIDRQMQLKLASATATAETENVNGEEHRKRWTVFQRVQRNRQSRLKQRSRKRTAPPTEHPCPVCNVSYPPNEIQQHAEQCLRRINGATNGREDNSSNEDDDEEEYEEYEWAGQKRIRVSSLLQGGYSAIGIGQALSNRNGGQQAGAEEEEEDLNVDEDDTQIYGPSQYGENDVIPPTIEQSDAECDVTSYMRRLLNAPNPSSSMEAVDNSEATAATQPTTDATTTNKANCIPNVAPPAQSTASSATKSQPAKHYHQIIIESLKAKLRHYENHVQSKFKCLICLDDYRNPAISVSCWHVHCEECWLRSLGARKLCPQCNLITTPKDLRRIYM